MTLEELQARVPPPGGTYEQYVEWLDMMRNLGDSGFASSIQEQGILEAERVKTSAYDTIIPMLKEQQGNISGQFEPFTGAGLTALPELQKSVFDEGASTPEGLEGILKQIMGGETFGGLVDERQRGVQGQLAAGGLTRSGTALKEAAAVPTDLAFDIESLLSKRQQQRTSGLESLVSTGMGATSSEAGFSNNILAQIMNAITGKSSATATSLMSSAEASANETLARAQRKASDKQNVLNTIGTIGSWGILGGDDD